MRLYVALYVKRWLEGQWADMTRVEHGMFVAGALVLLACGGVTLGSWLAS